MKAAILAIGTELTVGQIINRNASWISEKLKAKGLLTELHLTVPDERGLILESLAFCAAHADILFVTGGLGPTSDDFTRELISKWTSQPLEFDKASWDHINERLGSRGYQVTDIQKQQCYFPRGARILKNSQGTANAFHMKFQSKNIYVLPGPPREIEALWNDFIADDIEKLTSHIDRHQTLSWDTMGFGESQIAERIEKIAGESGFEIGYRVHLPYVEVKLSFFESERKRAEVFIQQIDQSLKDCTVTKNGEDILQKLTEKLMNFEHVEIYDSVTNGIFISRILPHARKFKSWLVGSDIPDSNSQKKLIPQGHIRLILKKEIDDNAKAIIQTRDEEKEFLLTSQLNQTMLERRLQLFTERALIFWNQEIKSRK